MQSFKKVPISQASGFQIMKSFCSRKGEKTNPSDDASEATTDKEVLC